MNIVSEIIDLNDFLPDCDPNKSDIEIAVVNKYLDINGQIQSVDLFNGFDSLVAGYMKITKDIDKVTELEFEVLEVAKRTNPDGTLGSYFPNVFEEISVEFRNHKTGTVANVFYGYVVTVDDKSNSSEPYKRYKIRCLGYEKALQDTIIVETFDGLSAKEIIEKIWTDRLVGTKNYNFPQPDVDSTLNYDLGRISHEDSIERLLEVLAKRTNSNWWFDDKSVLHFKAKATLQNKVVKLNQSDYDKIATPIQISPSGMKYANQVKFKASNIRGNGVNVTFGTNINGETEIKNGDKIHSYENIKDSSGRTYQKVNSIDKNSPLGQYVVSSDKITFWPLPANNRVTGIEYFKMNSVIVKNNIPEQTRLSQVMQIGYIISKDITNERLKTIEQVEEYCEEYLKNSIRETVNANILIHNLQTNARLSRWGFDEEVYDFSGMEFVYTDEDDCNVKTHNYDTTSMQLVKKEITLKIKHSRERNGKATLSNEDFIIRNEFVDGLRDVWEDRFKRDKKQIYDQEINDQKINEVDIDATVGFDIIADNLNVDGSNVPIQSTTVAKSRETTSITKAMVK